VGFFLEETGVTNNLGMMQDLRLPRHPAGFKLTNWPTQTGELSQSWRTKQT
jgi:hypothetical protein